MSNTLLQTALQNLHVSQHHTPRAPSPSPSQGASASGSPRPAITELDSDNEDEEAGLELVRVGQGTRPGTPSGSQRGRKRVGGLVGGRNLDPLRTLPTHLAVRVFLQLDIQSLARCDRVCKRWRKSSTLNYVWFLQNRALLLPAIPSVQSALGKTRQSGHDTPEFYDPYDKTPRLSSLPIPKLPNSQTPVWTKLESKKVWKSTFRTTLKRSDPNAEDEIDPLRVDISSLHTSGASTPGGGGGHGYAGMGSGGANKWASAHGEGMTNTERKVEARDIYKSLGGRKSRMKRKMGGEMGGKDRGGAADDGRFDAPW